MTPGHRVKLLNALGWQLLKHHDVDDPRCVISDRKGVKVHRCVWIIGNIEGVEHDAYLSCDDGTVMLHRGEDLTFEAFLHLVEHGSAVPVKPCASQRDLFGE